MKLLLIQVGKTKDSYIEEGLKEYLKRLQAFCDFETITLKESTGAKTKEEQIEEESTEILKKLKSHKDHKKILLDISGKTFSSEEFASQLKHIRDFESGKAIFIIGGPFGVSNEVRQASDLRLSVSSMTFTHQMIRLILLEQIYRAFTIIEGKKYHY